MKFFWLLTLLIIFYWVLIECEPTSYELQASVPPVNELVVVKSYELRANKQQDFFIASQ